MRRFTFWQYLAIVDVLAAIAIVILNEHAWPRALWFAAFGIVGFLLIERKRRSKQRMTPPPHGADGEHPGQSSEP
jgi:hypothetical protein